MSADQSRDNLRESALHFHQYPTEGKMEIRATKALANQRDLALAYSPGVAAPCEEIHETPSKASNYTIRGNLVAVISNGTAVLGLGNIGALASKPVMEGKAVLFKKFAGIDVFDIEVAEENAEKFIDIVAPLEPTFGGINLEDIKAPECFEIEDALKERMNIPVFHDDQHGTAIIVAAAVRNGLEIAGKNIEDVKIVASGAGAAALACLNLLINIGVKRENIWVTDIHGVVYEGRAEDMDKWKSKFAQATEHRTLADVISGADVFLGLSAAGVLKPELLKQMADTPLIMALANPTPEIMPDEARAVREDALICTGRSDFPNQVNNVLCFPYMFRGALDVGATAINEEMKMAAVEAIAAIAKEPVIDSASFSYGGTPAVFGPSYLIPTPFDSRLILRIAPAVAKAAMDTGVAARPIEDFDAYHDELSKFVFRSGMIMKPIIEKAKEKDCDKRIVFADGEDERVLRAVEVLLDEGMAEPILIGRPDVLNKYAERYGLTYKPGDDCAVINPLHDDRYHEYVDLFHELVGRKGITIDAARTMVRTNSTVIGCLAVRRGEAEGVICGLDGAFKTNLRHIDNIIGRREGVFDYSTLSLLLMEEGSYFLTDTHVTEDPTTHEIVEMTELAAEQLEHFGIAPKVALLSNSNFGSRDSVSGSKMREAYCILKEKGMLDVEGEMHGDAAISDIIRHNFVKEQAFEGPANLLVFPNLDAANIALNLLKVTSNALNVGPILLGPKCPAHVLTPSITTRGIVNMTAISVAEINARD